MENLDLLSNDLQITPPVQRYLTESARWGKFLSVIGFISCGLMIVGAFFLPMYFAQFPARDAGAIQLSGVMRTGLTVFYLVLALLFFFPCFYLYQFSAKMQSAIKASSQENFDESLLNLKSMFKFYAIFTIVILSLYALGVIAVIINAAVR